MADFLHLIGQDQLEAYDELKAERDKEKDAADRDYQSTKRFLKKRKAPREEFLELEEMHRLEVERIQKEFREAVNHLLGIERP